MVALGGLTRLTESGLSMVRWEPVKGAIPPLSDEAWHKEFADYQQSPQYQKVFSHLDLAGFKQIYWLEFFHRLLGRLTGLVFLLPYCYFLIKKRFSTQQAIRLGGIFLLGGLQGFMGWYMVKSGLVDNPQVSPLRLTAHLLLAVAILTMLIREILPVTTYNLPRRPIIFTIAILLIQLGLGGLMAGTDAGFIYNSFPLMDGDWLPPDFDLNSLNIATINFFHRWTAFLVAAGFLAIYLTSRQHYLAELSLFFTIIQLILGIFTLLDAVPVALASMHQICAILLWINAIVLYSRARRHA